MRLGRIPFANNHPVDWGHASGAVPLPPGAQVVKGTPAQLNRALARGDLDASAVSAAEYLARPADYALLSDLAIVSRGPVESVLLFARRPLHALGGATVAVTDQSATGAALVRIVLDEFLGLRPRPQYEHAATRLPDALRRYDAALLIGDDALRAGATGEGLEGHVHKLDLGKAWQDYTRTPMVYALWCARRDWAQADPDGFRQLAASLRASREWGLAHAREVAHAAARAASLPLDSVARYLDLLSFRLDADAARGLLTFAEKAHRAGALPRDPRPAVRDALARLPGGASA